MVIIYAVLIIVFFGGSLESYHLVPPIFNWMTEPLIYSLFIYSLFKKGMSGGSFFFPLFPRIVFFLFVGLVSSIYNGSLGFDFIFSIRLILRFYILYLAVLNLDLTESQIKKILYFVLFLFLIQIPTSVIKLFIYGQGEAAIGTYSVNEGSLSTMIPLIAIGYIVSFYIYYKRAWVSLACCAGFVAFAFIGGKRAPVFMIPVLIFFLATLIIITGEFKSVAMKISIGKMFFLLFFLTFSVVLVGLRYIPTLNPERKVGGSINFSHAAEFASEYTRNTAGGTPYTGGRLSTTKRIFSVMTNDGFERFLLGFSPGSYTESRFSSSKTRRDLVNKFKIIYGLTPLGYIQIEYGFLGVMIYFSILSSLFMRCVSGWRKETDVFWKMFLFGSSSFAFTMIFLWGCYHPPSMLGDTIPCVFFILMACAESRTKFVKQESIELSEIR